MWRLEFILLYLAVHYGIPYFIGIYNEAAEEYYGCKDHDCSEKTEELIEEVIEKVVV